MGGLIALQFVLDNPGKAHALALVGISPRPAPSRWRSVQLSLLGLLIRLSRSYAGSLTKKQLFAPNPDPQLVTWINMESLQTPTRVVLASLKEVKRFNVLERIEEIAVPTALIRGEYDQSVEPSVIGDMTKKIPDTQQFIIEAAGHNCMLENPEGFNAVMNSFLQQLLSGHFPNGIKDM